VALCFASIAVQVVAVLAHELGHWKLGHTICLMVSQQAIMLAQFVLFAVFRNSDNLMNSFGFTETKPVVVSLMLFMMVIGPIDKLISWLFNLLSRRCATNISCCPPGARDTHRDVTVPVTHSTCVDKLP
jgi:hypothetical protein